jgi:alpha-glucosidase
MDSMVERVLRDEPMWDQPEVHDVYRRWRKILDEYPGDRMAVAEAWTQTAESMAAFIRSDELHQTFNFHWLTAPWSAAEFAEVIDQTLDAIGLVEGSPTWVLSNHDVIRHVTRYGGGEVGLARAKAATLTMLALPGSAYLYQGEELGLEQVDVAPEFRRDPSWFRTGEPGRDGCRVPVPWGGSQAPYEFGPGTGQPWIPMPADWADVTVAAEAADPASTLAFYRAALAARRTFATTAGDAVDLSGTAGDVLVMRRGPVLSVTNCGCTPVPLPAGELLVASGPLVPAATGTDATHGTGATGDIGELLLPPNTAAWLHP